MLLPEIPANEPPSPPDTVRRPAVFVHEGTAIDAMAVAPIAVGQVVVVGDLIGICTRPAADGQVTSVALTGVFDLPRVPGAEIAAGTPLFWDRALLVASTGNGGGAHLPIGVAIAIATAAATDTVVRVRLRS